MWFVLSGVVEGSLFCDFETPSLCGFRTSFPGDTTVWTWGDEGTSLDHTLNSPKGQYTPVLLDLRAVPIIGEVKGSQETDTFIVT